MFIYPKSLECPLRGASIQTFTITIATHIYSTSTTPACTCYSTNLFFLRLLRLEPSRRRRIFIPRKRPETKPLLVPVRRFVHGHRRLRPALALAVRKRVRKIPSLRLHASNRFSRSIGFRGGDFRVLATRHARLVRSAALLGFAAFGEVARGTPVAFLDRFLRWATPGWREHVEPVARVPVVVGDVM